MPAKSEQWESFGKGKVGRFDRHPTGWEIHHCGHPTATWPWYAIAPGGGDVVSESGFAWRTLATAREHVEELIAGARVLSFRFSGEPRAVRRCYACSEPASGRAIPGGNPATPDVPACDRHRWAELGDNPLRVERPGEHDWIAATPRGEL